MTLSDDELRASLERAAATAPTLDLAAAARIVASTPQPRGITRRTRFIGLASAAASVAVALAVFGSIALRDHVPASQSPGASSAAIGTALPSPSPSSSPIAEPWADLVWETTDPAPFALAGTTLMHGWRGRRRRLPGRRQHARRRGQIAPALAVSRWSCLDRRRH